MRKTMVIAVREYRAAVQTKAFVISIVLMPVLMGGSIVIRKVMEDKVDIRDKRFAIVDQTGLIFDTIAEQAAARNANDIFVEGGSQRTQKRPRFLVSQEPASSDDPAQVALALSQRVRDEEVLGFLLIGPDVIHPGDDSDRETVAYHSNSPNYDDFYRWANGVINERVRQLRFADANLDPEVVARTTRSVSMTNLGLVAVDEEGRIIKAKETSRVAGLLLPLGMMMLMFMVIMVGAQPLMQSVIEEKMQRIAEVLLGSVSPFELMMGKLLGCVGVSLTIATIYLVGAFVAINRAGFEQFLPASLVWWFVVYLALAVLFYGSMFISIGAACSDMKEAQSMLTPAMLLIMVPLFVWMPVVKEPLSPFATGISLFPPATPMLMTLRMSVPPGIPLWQPLLGVVLVLATTIVCVFLAGRIFRVGLLMQGKGASLGEMLRWALRG